MDGGKLKSVNFFLIFLTVGCELIFSTIISIDFDTFAFPWSKTLVCFVPHNFSTTFIYKTLKISATLDSLFTSFSPSKRETWFPEMIPLFVTEPFVCYNSITRGFSYILPHFFSF